MEKSFILVPFAIFCISCGFASQELSEKQKMDLQEMEDTMKPIMDKIFKEVVSKNSKYEQFKHSPEALLQELQKDPAVFQEMVRTAMRQLSSDDITTFVETMTPDKIDVQLKKFKEELQRYFNSLDTEGNGYLSFDQVAEVIKEYDPENTIKEGDINLLINDCDTDRSGNINYTEFVQIISRIQKQIATGLPAFQKFMRTDL